MNDTLSVPTQYRDALKELRMFDDDFLKIIMQDKRTAEVIVAAILDGVSIAHIDSQKVLHYPSKRSLVYDIFVIAKKEYLDIEIEKHRYRISPMRIRYHASLLDVDISEPGMRFEDMKDIKVIFLCEFDPFDEGLPIYHIQDTVIETGELYEDRREIILVNAEAVEDGKLGELIHDLKQTRAQDMYNPVLKEVMKYFKETEGGIMIMCEIWDRIEKRGIEAGQTSSNINAIRNIMITLDYTITQAMELLKIPESEYEKYKELVLKL